MKIQHQWIDTKGWIYYRDWLLIEGVEFAKRPYVRFFKRRKKAWNLSNEQLLEFPMGSLGAELGHFLQERDLRLVDKLEDHDIMHVLLDLDTQVEAEAIMQFLLWGNGKCSLFCLGTAAISWLLLPAIRTELKAAYHSGKRMRRFHDWKFQFLLREPLPLLKAMLHKDFGELEAPFLW